MIYRMILLDIVPFSIVTCVFLVGFAHVIFLIGNSKNATTFFTMIGQLFEVLIGNVSFDAMEQQHNMEKGSDDVFYIHSFVPRMLSVCFILICIILLNLLIAMMGDTYSRITEDAKGEWLMQRAQIIFSIESNMSDAQLSSSDYKYWVDVDGKRFLQLEEAIGDAFQEFLTEEVRLLPLLPPTYTPTPPTQTNTQTMLCVNAHMHTHTHTHTHSIACRCTPVQGRPRHACLLSAHAHCVVNYARPLWKKRRRSKQ